MPRRLCVAAPRIAIIPGTTAEGPITGGAVSAEEAALETDTVAGRLSDGMRIPLTAVPLPEQVGQSAGFRANRQAHIPFAQGTAPSVNPASRSMASWTSTVS